MEFFILIIALPLLFVFISSVAVWVKTNNLWEEIHRLRSAVKELGAQVNALSRSQFEKPAPKPTAWDKAREESEWKFPQPLPSPSPIPSPTPVPTSTAASNRPPEVVERSAPETTENLAPETLQNTPEGGMPDHVRAAYAREKMRRNADADAELRRQASAMETVDVQPEKPAGNFEFQFGKRLPVWIGGLALALSGFYLVKYSIEQGWLTEQVRVMLGFLCGVALIAAARFIRDKKPNMADGERISQALAGAGISDLYVTFYAATSMYHFIPPLAGLCLMAVVTALAVILSVRHGMPIAVLGMMGGFVTPALIRTDNPSAPMLFCYLFFLVAGLFTTFRKRGWWFLSIPMTLLAFGWVLLWALSGNFKADDGLWLGLFIVAITAVILYPAAADIEGLPDKDSNDGSTVKTLNWLTAGAALGLMAFVIAQSQYGLIEWGFYAILALGSVAMAYFRPAEFRYLPAASLLVNLAMLASWRHAPDSTYALVQLGFAGVYALPALWLLHRQPSMLWGGLLSFAALGFYGLGYVTLKSDIYALLNMNDPDALHFWSALAILLSVGFASLTAKILMRFEGDPLVRDRLLALFSLITTAFCSVALTIEVHNDFLPVAFAAETLAVCWVAAKIDIKALRQIAGILFTVFLVLIFPQLAILTSVTFNSLFGVSVNFWGGQLPPLADRPLFQLGLPMVMLGAGSWFLRQREDSRLVEFFEMAVAGLGALMLYYLARHAFKVPEDVLFRRAGFMERGIITNIFFAASLAVIYAGRLFSRRALLWSGSLLFGMALFRVFYFDFFVSNPLWSSSQLVGAVPLFNWLVLPYLLPMLWLWLEERPQLRIATIPPNLRGGMILLLGFTWATLNVRQLFHGTSLMTGPTENAEIYSYSALWLLMGALLLFFGTLKKSKPLRVASLGLMIVTVGKVFLYDAGELSGLYRVFSFMGLGLSLLALSWFYSRFVFKKEE